MRDGFTRTQTETSMTTPTSSNTASVFDINTGAFAVRGEVGLVEPVSDDNARINDVAAQANVQPALRRVLIVDDNEDSAEAMAMLLERFGFQVSTAFSGESALEQQQQTQFDIVLLDLTLPDMHGTAVAERMRSAGFTGKLVAVSGNSEPAMKDRCLRAGMDQFMVKPCSADALRRLV